MFNQDTIAMLIGMLIVGCPVGIGLFLIFNTLRKEVIKNMQQGKTFWQALKVMLGSGNGYCSFPSNKISPNGFQVPIGNSNSIIGSSSYSNLYGNQLNSMSTGSTFMADPKYCSMPGNMLYNSSITGKY